MAERDRVFIDDGEKRVPIRTNLAPEDFYAAAEAAGWSDDPGTGKSVMVPDERGAPGYEIPNPIPMAPPVGYVPPDPLEQMIQRKLDAYLAGDTVIDETPEEADDFDVDDELPPLDTIYEVLALEPEAPAFRSDPTLAQLEAAISGPDTTSPSASRVKGGTPSADPLGGEAPDSEFSDGETNSSRALKRARARRGGNEDVS